MGEILRECVPIAQQLDALDGGTAHQRVLDAARAALMAPETLPSARVLAEMKMRFEGSHHGFIGAHSESTRAHMLALPFSADDEREYAELARDSVAAQARIE